MLVTHLLPLHQGASFMRKLSMTVRDKQSVFLFGFSLSDSPCFGIKAQNISDNNRGLMNILRQSTSHYRLSVLISDERHNARINAAGIIERSIQSSRMTSKLRPLALNELLCGAQLPT